MSTITAEDLRHHAVIVQTNEPTLAIRHLETLIGVSFSHVAHEDIVYRSYESIGIEEVRELGFLSLKKPVQTGLLHLIVLADALTTEAQHALLKQTEEPSESTHYIFVLPARVPLLATLRSRCAVVSFSTSTEEVVGMAETIALDLRAILKITKDKNDAAMEVRLRATEALVHKDIQKASPVARALVLARSYIEARGSSPKMLLEHIALSHHETKLQ